MYLFYVLFFMEVTFQFLKVRGAWVAQSVGRPTSAKVMISRSVNSSPASGSVLTAGSLEPTSDSVPPPLSAPPLLILFNLKKNFFYCLLLLRERETDRLRASREGAEGEGDTESEAGSRL